MFRSSSERPYGCISPVHSKLLICSIVTSSSEKAWDILTRLPWPRQSWLNLSPKDRHSSPRWIFPFTTKSMSARSFSASLWYLWYRSFSFVNSTSFKNVASPFNACDTSGIVTANIGWQSCCLNQKGDREPRGNVKRAIEKAPNAEELSSISFSGKIKNNDDRLAGRGWTETAAPNGFEHYPKHYVTPYVSQTVCKAGIRAENHLPFPLDSR